MICECKNNQIIKKGKYKTTQLYQCKNCKKKFRKTYLIQRMNEEKDKFLVRLHRLGLGTRSIGKAMEISHTCVMKTKLRIASDLSEPELEKGQIYQMDELCTFVAWRKKPKIKKNKKRKKDEYCVIHAIEAKTGKHAGFVVGKRTKKNIKILTDSLLKSDAKRIYTDGLNIYPTLIPKRRHSVFKKCTNRIERLNLTMRTHIKRFSRKTLCFSRSLKMMEVDLKLYFWN